MKKYNAFYALFLLLALASCGGSKKKTFTKTPVDEYITKLDKEKSYSVVLYDMDFDDNVYKHKYKVITNLHDSTLLKETISDWKNVEEAFFMENEDNLGMEILSKSEDGKLHKIPAPPGFNNYVGNDKYGEWKTGSNGESFWSFYGKYMFMSSMFNMMAGPVYRSSYMDYRGNYMGQRPYYGSAGRTTYGTSGSLTRNTNPTFHERNQGKTSDFKSRLRSRVSQSSGSSTSTSRSRSTTRSSSSSGSSSRSRGGSSGK